MIRRIVVVRAGALGDVVMALPAIRVLREQYPHATIEVAGYPALWEVAGPFVDRCIDIDRAAYSGLLTGQPSPRLLDLLEGVDLAIAWTVGDPSVLFEEAGVPTIIHASPFPPPGVHAINWLLESLETIGSTEAGEGFSPTYQRAGHRAKALSYTGIGQSKPMDAVSAAQPILSFSNEELGRARAYLDQHSLSAPSVVHPGASVAWKRWPEERFAAVVAELRRRGEEVALIEGPRDAEAVATVRAVLEDEVPVLRESSPRRLAAILSEAAIFVGNDTGVTHLAAAEGVPTVALFGPTDPASWAPRGDVRILRACNAHPTFQGQVRACDDPACFEGIGVEDVLAAMDQAILCRTV